MAPRKEKTEKPSADQGPATSGLITRVELLMYFV